MRGHAQKQKTPIESAVNTYLGNYCYRKCFRHDEIISRCMDKFSALIKEIGDIPITFREFRKMMDNDDIKICRLAPEKRGRYASWKYFEHLSRVGKDFWDVKNKQEK